MLAQVERQSATDALGRRSDQAADSTLPISWFYSYLKISWSSDWMRSLDQDYRIYMLSFNPFTDQGK